MFLSVWKTAAACVVLSGALAIQPGRAQEPDGEAQNLYIQLAGLGSTSYLGVNLADITNERAQALKLRDVHGVEITRIEDGSPAEKAGLKVGDVVLGYNGQRVEGMEQFGRFVRETPAGREVSLLISRNGSQQTIRATIGSRKNMLPVYGPENMGDLQFNMPEIKVPMPDVPLGFQSWRTALLGIEAESLSPQLAAFFGVKNGALVRSVFPGSAAEKAGLKAGDVITKVDQTPVASPSDVSNAVRAAQTKVPFPIQVMRDRREVTLNVSVSKDGSQGFAPMKMRVIGAPAVKM